MAGQPRPGIRPSPDCRGGPVGSRARSAVGPGLFVSHASAAAVHAGGWPWLLSTTPAPGRRHLEPTHCTSPTDPPRRALQDGWREARPCRHHGQRHGSRNSPSPSPGGHARRAWQRRQDELADDLPVPGCSAAAIAVARPQARGQAPGRARAVHLPCGRLLWWTCPGSPGPEPLLPPLPEAGAVARQELVGALGSSPAGPATYFTGSIRCS
jgi:hypothetical protein